MIGKLLKYNLKTIYRTVIIFFALAILSAVIGRLLKMTNAVGIIGFLSMVFENLSLCLVIGQVINTMMRLWVFFRKDFYGDEAYLTHTLPMSPRALFSTKFLTSLIVSLSLVVVGGLCFLISYWEPGTIEAIVPAFEADGHGAFDVVMTFVNLGLMLFLEIVFVIQCGFTGIIIGNRSGRRRGLKTFLAGFLTYAIAEIMMLGIIVLLSLGNADLFALLFTEGEAFISVKLMFQLFVMGEIIYIGFIGLSYLWNVKLLQKGVNID